MNTITCNGLVRENVYIKHWEVSFTKAWPGPDIIFLSMTGHTLRLSSRLAALKSTSNLLSSFTSSTSLPSCQPNDSGLSIPAYPLCDSSPDPSSTPSVLDTDKAGSLGGLQYISGLFGALWVLALSDCSSVMFSAGLCSEDVTMSTLQFRSWDEGPLWDRELNISGDTTVVVGEGGDG